MRLVFDGHFIRTIHRFSKLVKRAHAFRAARSFGNPASSLAGWNPADWATF
jgi:hypothetical protein